MKNTLPLIVLCLWISVACAQDEPFKPDFGSNLKRSGAALVIELADGKGAKLVVGENETVSLFCWRHVGKFHRSADANFDRSQSRIIANGTGGAGLEPGKYTLESSIAGYGQFRIEFEIKSGETLKREVKLPNWRRILTFKFVDEAGKAIEDLAAVPTYSYSWQQVTGFDNRNLVGMLREPPGQSRRGGAGGIGGGGRPGRRGPVRFSTDEGRVHLAVYAGTKGTIRFNYRGPATEFSDTFEQEEWEKEKSVTLVRDAAIDTRLAGLKPANALGAGNKALQAPLGAQPDTAPEKGIFIDLLGDKRLYPEFEDRRNAYRDKETGVWFAEYSEDEQVELPRYRLTDGRFYSEPWQTYKDKFENGKLKTWRKVEATEIVVRLKDATHAAWASWFRVDLPSAFEPNYQKYPDWPLAGGSASIWVSPEQLAALQEERSLKIAVGGGYSQEFRRGAILYQNGKEPSNMGAVYLRWGSQTERVVQDVPLGEAQLKALTAGKLELEIALAGLCLRAVSPGRGGLSHVCLALHPLEEDAVAQRLRAKEQELGQERPNIVYLDRDTAAKLAAADDKTSDNELRDWLGETIYDALGERDLRLRFGKFGAWYDSRQQLESNEHGYVIAPQCRLEAGKQYVLYLWSRSRDDLKPDKRIVFTAGKDVTDLGAIELPWFEE